VYPWLQVDQPLPILTWLTVALKPTTPIGPVTSVTSPGTGRASGLNALIANDPRVDGGALVPGLPSKTIDDGPGGSAGGGDDGGAGGT
jgi:hypothetical protein